MSIISTANNVMYILYPSLVQHDGKRKTYFRRLLAEKQERDKKKYLFLAVIHSGTGFSVPSRPHKATRVQLGSSACGNFQV